MKKSIWVLGGILTVVILAGALMIGGLSAPRATGATSVASKTGITQNYTNSQSTAAPSFDGIAKAKIDGNVQTVETALTGGIYAPIIVQKGIPVKWVVTAQKGDINSCNNEIIISNYNVDKKLKPGENVIEFTPTESGTFIYSCWMGMTTSTVTVVNDINNITEQDRSSYSEGAASSSSGGCNMSGSGSSGGGCCGIIN